MSAPWTEVAISAATLIVALGAFEFARRQLDHSRRRAQIDRLNDFKNRITSQSTAAAIIAGERLLPLCKDEHGNLRLDHWDGLRAVSEEARIQRAGVIYVLNLLEEMAEDCERHEIDPAEAKRLFREVVMGICEKWGWLIDEYHDRARVQGLKEDMWPWIFLARKANRW